ncbi:hypothetical protein [Streptomyces sp. NPDC059881]|uniref:hypothetical protein n=1 Tax=Streptomyces sp. NPDC059881 TaxID=3346986 RepID=UPI00365D7E02
MHLGGALFPRTTEEVVETIEAVFSAFPSELRFGDYGHAEFYFVSGGPAFDLPYSSVESSLMIDMNVDLGLGVATWWCGPNITSELVASGKDHLGNSAWVSLTSGELRKKGEVVLDPHAGTFASPRSILPLSALKAVVEEYCLAGCGFRPEAIQWGVGTHTGELL